MLSLRHLLNSDVYDNGDVLLGVLRDALIRKADGKILLKINDEFFLAEKIRIEDDCVVVYNSKKTEGNGLQIYGKTLYEYTGKRLGEVCDVTFSNFLNTSRIVCDNGRRYPRGQLVGCDDVAIVRIPQKKSPKPQSKKEKKKICANAQPTENAPVPKTSPTIRRRYGDFSFLLGKVADKNITNFFNEVMIRTGERVTVETLRQAKLSGKLLELCLHVN